MEKVKNWFALKKQVMGRLVSGLITREKAQSLLGVKGRTIRKYLKIVKEKGLKQSFTHRVYDIGRLGNQPSIVFAWSLLIVYFALIAGLATYCLKIYMQKVVKYRK